MLLPNNEFINSFLNNDCTFILFAAIIVDLYFFLFKADAFNNFDYYIHYILLSISELRDYPEIKTVVENNNVVKMLRYFLVLELSVPFLFSDVEKVVYFE